MRPLKQRDGNDCGPTCVAYLAQSLVGRTSVAEIRQYCRSDHAGVSALELIRAGGAVGLSMRGVRATIDGLRDIPLPVIAHVRLGAGVHHYVVITRFKRGKLRVMNPASGCDEMWDVAEFSARWTGVLLLATAVRPFEPTKDPSYSRRLWQLLTGSRLLFLCTVAASVVSLLLAMGSAMFIGAIVDNVLPSRDVRLLHEFGACIATSVLLSALFHWIQAASALSLAQRVDAMLIYGYYRHVCALPQRFFDTTKVGEIITRVTDAVKIRDFVHLSLVEICVSPLVIGFACAALFIQSARLGALTLALLPLSWLMYRIGSVSNKRAMTSVLERNAQFESIAIEALETLPASRGWCREARVLRGLEVSLTGLLRAVTSAGMGMNVLAIVMRCLTGLYVVAVLWIGGYSVLRGTLSIGELIACFALSHFLLPPVEALVLAGAKMQEARVAADRLYEIMDLRCAESPGGLRGSLPSNTDIEVRSVHFEYSPGAEVLSGVNLIARPGEMTLLRGESGGGKSTILALLQRTYDPSSGEIYLGKVEAKAIPVRDWRSRMGVVPQEVALFRTSIVNNITLSDDGADIGKVYEICERLRLGEGGGRKGPALLAVGAAGADGLSGGQKQRIAIARLMYFDPPVWLLDEPTSALDGEGEDIVWGILDDARKRGRTVVIASHSERAVALADVIYSIVNGRAVTNKPAVSVCV